MRMQKVGNKKIKKYFFFKEWQISNKSGHFRQFPFSNSQVLGQRFPKWYDKWQWAQKWALQGQFKILTDFLKKILDFLYPLKRAPFGQFWRFQWYQPTTLGRLKGFHAKNPKFTTHDLELWQNSWEWLKCKVCHLFLKITTPGLDITTPSTPWSKVATSVCVFCNLFHYYHTLPAENGMTSA